MLEKALYGEDSWEMLEKKLYTKEYNKKAGVLEYYFKIKNYDNEKINEVKINPEYKVIIQTRIDQFNNLYKDKQISEKL